MMLEAIVPDDYLADINTHFVINKIIGYGGMGLCFLADDIKHQKKVALKILHPDLQKNAEALAQLKQEAEIEKKFIGYKHIIQTHDLLCIGSISVKIMEWMQGVTLKSYLQQKNIARDDLRSKVEVAMTEALQSVHALGIVHGDVKPANIFMGWGGEIILFDFGIARDVRVEGCLNFSAFSARYTSPRVLAGHTPGPGDDFYSLKQVLLEIG